jgi:hypothetical protein
MTGAELHHDKLFIIRRGISRKAKGASSAVNELQAVIKCEQGVDKESENKGQDGRDL